jgi:hypothetical protein
MIPTASNFISRHYFMTFQKKNPYFLKLKL